MSKATKFFTLAETISAKFDAFCFKLSLLQPRFDLNSCLQLNIEECTTGRRLVLTCMTTITSSCSNCSPAFV